MLIVLETGRRDLHRLGIEHAANPERALQHFLAAMGSELQHIADMHHVTADEVRRPIEFFAYQTTIGVALPPSDRILTMVDFS